MTTRRRFLVHLSCVRDPQGVAAHFTSRIHPWVARNGAQPETGERIFLDECNFIETINSVLPQGSDVRNIFSHIEAPEGFYYLLELDEDEARRLGWSGIQLTDEPQSAD